MKIGRKMAERALPQLVLAALLCGFAGGFSPLGAQTQTATQRQSKYYPEFGFWVGASNPVPGTALDQVLDPNIGGGFFMRFRWPWIFHMEFGFSYAHYSSRT
ncbi:MAG: hypothetical protein HY042_03590, partial [Spirochaetia bacterium]|nr:hypothetical protein [Spirochaetia bacterium]